MATDRTICLTVSGVGAKMKAVTSPLFRLNMSETLAPAPTPQRPADAVRRQPALGRLIATVSRVFSGKARVSDEIRKRVMDAARRARL